MTNKDTISQLTELIGDRKSFIEGDAEHDEIYLKDIAALNKAIDAIERRIPQRPGKGESAGDIFYFCDRCDALVRPTEEPVSYCQWCGQAIDWKEVSS